MSTEPLTADDLRKVAERLVAKAHVPAGALAQLGTAYLEIEKDLEGRRERAKLRGGKPFPPVTEDGRLVARALERQQRLHEKIYTLGDLAADCNVARTQLSRCNNATRPVKLSEVTKVTLLCLCGEKTWEDVEAATRHADAERG